ncbi:1,2-phenylacetyl-CoA epoxidase subunit PaaC [Yinghuangia seranimata]|uniref:1,2-phenylacetyl-CoA epoxidase subunit PaaC n=1 Tax=Yinghuangia seranimata TaxID=408067 RepID=UPI00248BC95C|nr:1,2-phenylacetyl-CoA epoxidase subunit PaaC [Yinghuangia seranimata]MDI2124812.1 phenylacetate-CoA oxygenase subunit PaaC [Yinghuangia seranimata]
MDDAHSAPAGPDSGSDARWAFGTGFTDPLHGVDTALAAGTDAAALVADCLALGDDALISAQRLAQWCTRAPELEVEMALANIGLDLIGQARLLYSRAGQADGTGRTEDDYAYARGPADFRNVRLTELPNGDYAFTIARLLVLSAWRLAVSERLTDAADPVLRAIATKGVGELTYHREFAAGWAVRLGDGTDVSHARMQRGFDDVLPYLGELFEPGATVGVDAHAVRDEVVDVLHRVVRAAGLTLGTPPATEPGAAGRAGRHTEHLAPLLHELQSVARALPGAVW